MFRLKKSKNRQITRETIITNGLHHDWIRSDKYMMRFFGHILADLSDQDFNSICHDRELCFLYSPGRYASALPNDKQYNFIIIYPELYELIKSVDNSIAYAVIFHELGHIYCQHHKSNKNWLEKEFEADHFAIKHGYASHLIELLSKEKRTFEIEKRIEFINSLITSH